MRLSRLAFLGIIVATVTAAGISQGAVTPPEPSSVLTTLRQAHPRLMLTDNRLADLKKRATTDTLLTRYVRDVIAIADATLDKRDLKHVLVGPRLLSVSRDCMARVYSLGLAWRWTGDEKYARALKSNLLTVCAFPDWNPSHFLDVAEMTHAVGVGYDWLYPWLDDTTRVTIRSGLIRHGIEPGVKAYRGEGGIPNWWIESYHNWNQVCNGGLIAGALAVAETDPDYARAIIPAAVASFPRALGTYGPDGAWPEGPGYWHYASRYTSYGLCALRTALGTDYGLTGVEGLSVTGRFPVYTTGPTGLFVNYADSGERSARRTMPCMFWLAMTYDDPFVAEAEHAMAVRYGARPEHVMWYVPRPRTSPEPDLDRLFGGSVEVAVMRSGWYDSNALFVGVKAGYNQVNHGHLDLGTFELDALGVRWVRDLGSDNYNLPDYWGMGKGATRWTYYRLNSFSHNIPILGGVDQDVMAKSSFTGFVSGSDGPRAKIDLTAAYAPLSSKTTRGVTLIGGRKAALVQDEFVITGTTSLDWGITTDAAIDVNSSTAVLRLGGKRLTVRALEPSGAIFTVESAEQKPPQKTNTGVNRLMLKLPRVQGSVRVAVLFSPEWPDGAVTKAEVSPLGEW